MSETTLKPYSDYRDPELRWLDDIPSHWDVQRAKNVFSGVDKRSQTGKEELLTVSSGKGVRPREEQTVTMFQAESYVGHKLCWPGDLVINSLWAWARGLGVSEHHGIVSTAYGVYRPKKPYRDYTSYFHLLLRSEAYDWELTTRSQGIWTSRLQLSDARFFDMPILLPPEEEARQIGTFVKTIDRKVNRLIDAKERLIALLEEQKQGLIQRAVTRGLDPQAEMKPSGVDWLGEVPAHWETSRIKNELRSLNHRRIPLSTSERGKMKSCRYNYYGASGVIDKVDDYLFDDDLILIAEDGANLLLRNLPLVVIARGKFWVNNHAHILEPQRGNLKFWAHLLETLSYAPWIKGAAQPKLTQDRLMRIPIPVPPIDEQRAIVKQIQERTSHLDETIQKSESEIDLIREYRTRLVSDVVTGKLDVREAEATAPEAVGGDGMAAPDQLATNGAAST